MYVIDMDPTDCLSMGVHLRSQQLRTDIEVLSHMWMVLAKDGFVDGNRSSIQRVCFLTLAVECSVRLQKDLGIKAKQRVLNNPARFDRLVFDASRFSQNMESFRHAQINLHVADTNTTITHRILYERIHVRQALVQQRRHSIIPTLPN